MSHALRSPSGEMDQETPIVLARTDGILALLGRWSCLRVERIWIRLRRCNFVFSGGDNDHPHNSSVDVFPQGDPRNPAAT